MYRFFLAAVDLLPAMLLLVPSYLILNRAYFHNTRKSSLYCIFSCYLAVVYVLVGLPNVTYIRPEVNLNLIPVIGMIEDWKNSILNVALFVPLGMMLPLLWNPYQKIRKTLLFGLATSLVVELLQLLTFRATDVNDLITNTVGTYLGYICAKALLSKHPMAGSDKTVEVAIVVISVVLVMFFLYPFVSSVLWNFPL